MESSTLTCVPPPKKNDRGCVHTNSRRDHKGLFGWRGNNFGTRAEYGRESVSSVHERRTFRNLRRNKTRGNENPQIGRPRLGDRYVIVSVDSVYRADTIPRGERTTFAGRNERTQSPVPVSCRVG